MSYLNFEDERFEKGYTYFKLTRENIKANIGKRIVYLRNRDVDPYRGTAFPRYGTIKGIRYSQIMFDNDDSIDMRDVIECGIEVEKID